MNWRVLSDTCYTHRTGPTLTRTAAIRYHPNSTSMAMASSASGIVTVSYRGLRNARNSKVSTMFTGNSF